MKTLLILRHAKSSWKDDDTQDHDRPLNKRGKRDAPRMGQLLQEQRLCPDLILSSTAKRARKTASKTARQCEYQGIIELDGTLYLAAPDAYVAALRKVDDQLQCVMVVGHNPGLEQWLAMLTGHAVHLPTATLAHVELELTSWQELNSQTHARLVALWNPGELP
jgi:phosphohistidine phosphatase